MKILFRRWRFLPPPIAALYQNTFLIRRALFTAIAPIAHGVRGDILDFGCGSKPYRSLFVNCDSYIGVDVAVSGHDHVDSLVDIYYNGDHLPFEDSKFDAVVAFEVFEHVFNTEKMLAELARVLKNGGEIVLTVPFAWPEHEIPFDFGRYTSFGIRSVMERNGYDIQSIIKTNGTVEALHQLWINYLTVNVFNRMGVVGRFLRIFSSGIINLSATIFSRILPDDKSYYSNLVVHAKRRT